MDIYDEIRIYLVLELSKSERFSLVFCRFYDKLEHSVFLALYSNPNSPIEPEKPEFQETELRFTKPLKMIPPRFLDQIPERVEVEENEPIVLRFRVDGQPNPTLQCILDGKSLQQTHLVRCVFEVISQTSNYISECIMAILCSFV